MAVIPYQDTGGLKAEVQRRLARSVTDEQFNHWVLLCEDGIKNGYPVVGNQDSKGATPPLRVKEMESGRQSMSPTGMMDLGHPIFTLDKPPLDILSISCQIGGNLVVDGIEYTDERTFFSRRTDSVNSVSYTHLTLPTILLV